MTEEVAKPDWKWDDFYQAEREAATVGDKVVGVPALVDNLAIVYNKKLFADAGVAPPTPEWTWDDFRAAAAKLTDPAEGAVRLADPRRRQRRHCLALPSDALGGRRRHPELRQHARPTFNSEAGVKALTDAAADGRQRQVALPRHHQRERPEADEQRQGRDAGHRPVGSQPAVRHRLRRAGDAHLRRLRAAAIRPSPGPDNWVVFDNGDAAQAGGHRLREVAVGARAGQGVLAAAPATCRSAPRSATTRPCSTSSTRTCQAPRTFVENLKNVKKVRPTGRAVSGDLRGARAGDRVCHARQGAAQGRP